MLFLGPLCISLTSILQNVNASGGVKSQFNEIVFALNQTRIKAETEITSKYIEILPSPYQSGPLLSF